MKKIIGLLLTICIMTLMCSVALAAGVSDFDFSPQAIDGLDNTALSILGLVQWIGYGIAIGMVIFCGIKYVMSGAGEKAKIKDTLVPLLVGGILIGGATAIGSAIFNAFAK